METAPKTNPNQDQTINTENQPIQEYNEKPRKFNLKKIIGLLFIVLILGSAGYGALLLTKRQSDNSSEMEITNKAETKSKPNSNSAFGVLAQDKKNLLAYNISSALDASEESNIVILDLNTNKQVYNANSELLKISQPYETAKSYEKGFISFDLGSWSNGGRYLIYSLSTVNYENNYRYEAIFLYDTKDATTKLLKDSTDIDEDYFNYDVRYGTWDVDNEFVINKNKGNDPDSKMELETISINGDIKKKETDYYPKSIVEDAEITYRVNLEGNSLSNLYLSYVKYKNNEYVLNGDFIGIQNGIVYSLKKPEQAFLDPLSLVGGGTPTQKQQENQDALSVLLEDPKLPEEQRFKLMEEFLNNSTGDTILYLTNLNSGEVMKEIVLSDEGSKHLAQAFLDKSNSRIIFDSYSSMLGGKYKISYYDLNNDTLHVILEQEKERVQSEYSFVISNDGRYVIFNSDKGLKIINISNAETRTISSKVFEFVTNLKI